MIQIEGAHAAATVYTVSDDVHAVDDYARAQIKMICDTEACSGSRIRIMPDVHAGKVGPIGLTMTVGDSVLPALVGNDIGCGVSAVEVKAKKGIDFAKLDKVVRESVRPQSGNLRREGADAEQIDAKDLLSGLRCRDHVQVKRALSAVGTLGGGNHFIELDRGSDGRIFLVVHSGSRILGTQVYEWYMQAGGQKLKEAGIEVPREMVWLEGELLDAYLVDMRLVCRFAELNRRAMLRRIMKGMKWKAVPQANGSTTISCAHNYIGSDGILRKGAISACLGETVLIPANMRDGIILGVGRGNEAWNHSAPHGSGRILKRSDVADLHTLSEFKREMHGVWSSTMSAETLDEAPFAYRELEQIRNAIGETVDIIDTLKPMYNYRMRRDEA